MERVKKMETTFVYVTTLVVLATALYITVFWGTDLKLGVEILWQILLTSFLTSVGMLFCPKGEPSKKQFVVKEILYYIYVNIVVLTSGFIYEWFYLEDIKMVIGMLILIAVVYIIINVVLFLKDISLTKKLNEKLEERNRMVDLGNDK